MQQPLLKKLATDGSMGVMPINSLAVDKQGLTGGFSASTAVGSSDVGLSSMSQQLASENISGGRREVGTRALKASAVLAQAWKDVNAGQLSASLFEYFGESMFCFTPSPELSLFL